MDYPTAEKMLAKKVVDSDKIWATLITNTAYLPGLLTLSFSLRRVSSRYPLVALHTGTLPPSALAALSSRGIPTQQVPVLHPGPSPFSDDENDPSKGWYADDPRFRASFTKLVVFGLTGYERVCLLDADMVVVRNMDELFGVELDREGRLLAATHACVCNPRGFGHYPRDWKPAECDVDGDSSSGRGNTNGAIGTTTTYHGHSLGQLNGGLLLLRPSPPLLHSITTFLASPTLSPATLPFADQSLLSTLFHNRWTPLPYIYNALKPMREAGVHGGEMEGGIWRDGGVKCVHYILTPKPWELKGRSEGGVLEGWWWEVEGERRRWEDEMGIGADGEKGGSCSRQMGELVGEGRWSVVG
ncbi:nucleotide-diphospho-sugar transferase [Staphylotrichum tortipilum]|uniref:Nucleotide-diphospho-sugar transferase n=1 Tax=Staphylotrichum tortipilum TaxID=2831512 RepID=A0AAN6MSW6_9PEZI|nr:nucleotide-diphospho-sugar transferase [Staphylotrichum longicolle]